MPKAYKKAAPPVGGAALLYRVSVSCDDPCQWRAWRKNQYQQCQYQNANNNGRHNNGAQHGQNDSMESGTGAAEGSAGAGGGHGLMHLTVHGVGHAGRLLRFKSVE